MKCLTVRQPWAWAIFRAGKDVENRSRSTSYRGPLAIHVSSFHQWRTISDSLYWCETVVPGFVIPDRLKLNAQLGCIIGIVDVVDCVRDSASPWALKDHWHWVLSNPQRVRPVPIVGQLGIFEREVDLEVLP